MTKLKHYYLLFIVPLLIIACSSGNNGTLNNSPANNSYTFKGLIAQNNMTYTPPPAGICPGVPIVRDPSLTPPATDCGPNSPNHNWCLDDNSSVYVPGFGLSNSVVGIELYNPLSSSSGPASWELKCNGTIIDQQWVLTAAHCIKNYATGEFNDHLYVVPWQQDYHGIPTKLRENDFVDKYEVETIYIPQSAAFAESHAKLYPNYYQDDYALLKLTTPLPSQYVPIPLESQLTINRREPLLSAAFKKNESQVAYFGYRNNIYNDNLTTYNSYDPVNVGQLYTIGTASAMYNHEGIPYTWSFMSDEDSGSPLIRYDSNKQPVVVGIAGTGEYCNYPEFFAPTLRARYANLSVPAYYDLINNAMDVQSHLPTVPCTLSAGSSSCSTIAAQNLKKVPCTVPSESSEIPICIIKEPTPCPGGSSNSPSCSYAPPGPTNISIYILSSKNNEIYGYHKDPATGNLTYIASYRTGINPQKMIFNLFKNWILVINSGNNSSDQGSISTFHINDDGSLTANGPPQFNEFINQPVDIKFFSNIESNDIVTFKSFVYVLNKGSNIISSYTFNNQTGQLNVITTGSDNRPSLTPVKAATAITVDQTMGLTYVANTLSNKVSIFKNNFNNGNLNYQSDIDAISPIQTASDKQSLFVLSNIQESALSTYTDYILDYTESSSYVPTTMLLTRQSPEHNSMPQMLYVATKNNMVDIYNIIGHKPNLVSNFAACNSQSGLAIDDSHTNLFLICNTYNMVIQYKVLNKAPWLQLLNTYSNIPDPIDMLVAN